MAIRARRRRGVWVVLAVGGLIALLALPLVVAARSAPIIAREDLRIPGVPEPDGTQVTLEASIFLPPVDGAPAPAVVLAHGFGGNKEQLVSQAELLARQGYVVATYTARGFGSSGGRIHLDARDFEVKDAALLLDTLARRTDVQLDAAGDPRVAVVGASYGGALALQLAGTDQRVDAIVPMITWNDLEHALFPQYAQRVDSVTTPAGLATVPTPGVFKRLWAGALFAAGTPAPGTAPEGSALGLPSASVAGCGRFDPTLCAAYSRAARTGTLDSRMRAAIAESSPAAVLSRITAPTLLIQGESDSLFPLSEADANAQGIARTGTPVRVAWVAGGHDGGFDSGGDPVNALVLGWLDQTIGEGAAAATGTTQPPLDTTFEAEVPRTVRTRGDRDRGTVIATAPGLTGTGDAPATPTTTVPLLGSATTITSPAGGTPASLTALPGLDFGLVAQAAAGLDEAAAVSPPGQSAVFESGPIGTALRIVGAPRARISVASTAPEAVVFASLQVVAANGQASLPQRLVSPIRATGLGGGPRTIDIALPAIVRDVPADAHLRLVVTSTDAAYWLPSDPRSYTVGLADPEVVIPVALDTAAGGGSQTSGTRVSIAVIAAGLAAVAALTLATTIALRNRRAGGRSAGTTPPSALTPIWSVEARALVKEYGDGYRAVDDLSFTVGCGQVLGLLGPNGAGKTTTLRMLLGLINPTDGEILVFGRHIEPGAGVLERVGAMVEGPGLLPHLTGWGNLRAFWQVTGRPVADAHFDIALQIAGLGTDLHRKVSAYSHGMKQRLAIAQAMLGLPDLLVLDEPTNGLDPPQIAEMREVLRSYAATGRTVVLSSHLLAEVEATCTHLVVMAKGRLVAEGPVADVVGSAATVIVGVSEPVRAAEIARALPGTADVRLAPGGISLRLPGASRPDLVRMLVGGGVAVDRITPQHSLEEAFLALVDQDAP